MRMRTTWLEASIAVGIALWLTPAACATEINTGVLDHAESNICRARAGLERARAAAAEARHQSIPVEQLADQLFADPAARARMQRKLDARLLAAQDEIVENHRRDLDRYQDEYRRLTGSSFDAAARLFPAGQVDKSRRAYDEFTSSYQREHGMPFDPARCR